jgi:hypothetical protein
MTLHWISNRKRNNIGKWTSISECNLTGLECCVAVTSKDLDKSQFPPVSAGLSQSINKLHSADFQDVLDFQRYARCNALEHDIYTQDEAPGRLSWSK